MMLLNNVTVDEEGQKHLIGEGKTKGLILDNLFGMFCFFIKSNIFDFVSNILSNITALKDGRDLLLQKDSPAMIFPKIIDMLRWQKVNGHRRQHLLECLRNLAFEYESQESLFFDSNLVKEVAHMLAQEQGLSILPESVNEYQVPLNKEEDQIS
jgi:hypothetical protein